MENKYWTNSSPVRSPVFQKILLFSVLVAVVTGCGAPGDPTPPSPPIPTTVSDLTGRQFGDGVQLTFTMPRKSVSGDTLSEAPAVEILRGALKADGSPDNKSFRLVYTIPGSLSDLYTTDRRMQFVDPVDPEEIRAHPGGKVAYRVRSRVSKKKASADSNTVIVRLFPVAEKLPAPAARVTESAIELTWPIPAKSSGGGAIENLSGYHVYRGELDPSSTDAASHDLAQAVWIAPPVLLAPTTSNAYRDALFDFGKTYVYFVRSVTVSEGTPLESADSAPAFVMPKDAFPPSAPQGLVVAVLPGEKPPAIVVELSWSISPETDLAGYRVYRSDSEGTTGISLTPELLLTPAYRDMTAQPDHHYWYRVTAVDRAGNESVPSSTVATEETQHSQ